jgi:hypothetical protein
MIDKPSFIGDSMNEQLQRYMKIVKQWKWIIIGGVGPASPPTPWHRAFTSLTAPSPQARRGGVVQGALEGSTSADEQGRSVLCSGSSQRWNGGLQRFFWRKS